MTDHPTSVRLDDAQIADLEYIAALLSAAAHGAPVSRSSAIQLALQRGIDLMLGELEKQIDPMFRGKVPMKREVQIARGNWVGARKSAGKPVK